MITVIDFEKDLAGGVVYLQVDYFKRSGKWYGGGLVSLQLSKLKELQFDKKRLLSYIDDCQNILQVGSYKEFFMVVLENHYRDTESYCHFFSALYIPEVVL